LKALNRAIDRFCTKHRRFGVSRLMRYIVFISVGVFLINMMDRSGMLIRFMYFDPDLIIRGQIWRLLTWVFIPPTLQSQINLNLILIALMLYFYYFIGNTLEREWGTPKFNVYYFFGVLLNIIYGFLMYYIAGVFVWLAPDFLNLSMFFAFAVLFPNHRVLLFFILPIKMKWLALISAGYFIYSILSDVFAGQLTTAFLPLVAMLNFIVICGEDLLTYMRPYTARRSAQTIRFKKAARDAQREHDENQYRHKCAVCGRTDLDTPGLEFRYCSRCNGYHCFCVDHINNHIHFQ